MRLSDVIQNLPITGAGANLELTGVSHDSRRIRPGDLYVAIVGERFDGRIFVDEALERGASAVLAQGPPPSGLEDRWLRTTDPRQLLGPLAARLYRHPDRELILAGVTGTNGKSTVVTLLAAILEAAGHPAASLGTLGYRFRDLIVEGERTTPEAADLFEVLRRMRDVGAEAAAMEVSSHALALGRVRGATYDVAVFTNLTRDHFDFHEGFEDYFAAKRRLFEQLKPTGVAVVNVDDPYGARLAEELEDALTFGRQGAVRVREAALDQVGIQASIETPAGELTFASPLLGRYNLENLLTAAAAGVALRLPLAAIAEGIATVGPVAGRMERLDRGQSFPVLLDYAHTDAALAATLRSLREIVDGKILLVFGCGGGRDVGKRLLMGRVAGALADRVIITSDNPRGEDPRAIAEAVEEGLRQSGNTEYELCLDRREAIRRAIGTADGSAVLVAGKGHEEVQILADREIRFSDRDEILEALEDALGTGNPG